MLYYSPIVLIVLNIWQKQVYWHRVKEYLDALPVGTLLADVGSGDGKYFGVNPGVVTIGMSVIVIVTVLFIIWLLVE